MTTQIYNKQETLACLIIDDPLLRPKYGCLDYKKLLGEMKSHNFFTEIAFIPWNYKRSDSKTVRLFADNPEYFAICVHGCNHLGNEYGGNNYRELCALSSTALWRMEQHKNLTGLGYDPVFVFPQGHFSSIAMKALKDSGFFAAFNSTIKAVDMEEPSLIEYQQPATKIYHGFPLFLRRYPIDKTKFIEDISSGRPILIVEHHAIFRDGYETITDFVDWVNSLGKIRWTSLLQIAESYLKEKPQAPGITANLSPSSMSFNTKVAARRYLSEARDNLIEPNRSFTKIYRSIRKLVGSYAR